MSILRFLQFILSLAQLALIVYVVLNVLNIAPEARSVLGKVFDPLLVKLRPFEARLKQYDLSPIILIFCIGLVSQFLTAYWRGFFW